MPEYDVSIVIPSLNEADSLRRLVTDIYKEIRESGKSVEVIVVDDGSSDHTLQVLSELQDNEKSLTVVIHEENLGKSRCLMDGFALAVGEYIGFIDADYQFHPKDFPALIAALDNAECDFANGVRETRHDPSAKKVASKIFNSLNSILFPSVDVKDWNSGIKLMRAEIAKSFVLSEGDHRLLVAMTALQGRRIRGYPITHTEREFGRSKYGGARLLTGPFDLLALKVKHVISKRPFTLFGIIGMAMILIGVALGLLLVYEQQVVGNPIGDRPLLNLVVLFEVFGFQMFAFGYLAEKIRDLERMVGPSVRGEIIRNTSNEEQEKQTDDA